MIKRKIQGVIEKSLKKYPVVGILGPRQVGNNVFTLPIKNLIKIVH